ncbi:glycosyltransferase [Lithospermum erythrorhizon]|uniref:Glycosyltransferase n=1 Tax=Lithospermum erythrorhizon TaxID=34254 RepID=A0AAV3PNK2_LITER
MSTPHILAIPFAAQGHVIPLMELALHLAKHGIKTTFVNTEFNHPRVVKALSDTQELNMVELVSIPDGLEPWEDRNDLKKLCVSIESAIPLHLEPLIKKINESGGDKISCVIADENMGFVLKVAEQMGLRRVAFWSAASISLALQFSIPKLVEDGVISNDGTLLKSQMIQLSPNMPSMDTSKFLWACIGDKATQKVIFHVFDRSNEELKYAEWLICNSAYELENAAFEYMPNAVPIGPLLACNRLGKPAGSFWPEDPDCLAWLDQQEPKSVIYVAFGSFTVFDEVQFQELALGLELTNRPFLWVVRPDITDNTDNTYPDGFRERIQSRGRLVGWARQQQVLQHPSIACFLSHCGWNSTLEGISNGVPFLTWPYFGDQFFNQTYICDEWKVGLDFKKDESGIIRRDEIKNKVDQLLSDQSFKARALNMQEKAIGSVTHGGSSTNNLSNFIKWIKEKST